MSDRPEHEPDEWARAGRNPHPSGLSRRGLLSMGTVGAIALVATACSNETPTPETAPGGGDDSGGDDSGGDDGGGGDDGDDGGSDGDGEDDTPGADLTLATTAVSLELLAVATYDSAVKARDEGRLGDVPAALSELLNTLRAHHVAHRDAWSELVGTDAPEPSPALAPMETAFSRQATELADASGLARLAVTVEQSLADTYLTVIPSLSTDSVLRLAATIQPIDSQHAAIARFLLGEYPVPEVFSEGVLAFGGGG